MVHPVRREVWLERYLNINMTPIETMSHALCMMHTQKVMIPLYIQVLHNIHIIMHVSAIRMHRKHTPVRTDKHVSASLHASIHANIHTCTVCTRINVPSELWACARTRVMRRAHTRKLGAHLNVSSKILFARFSYSSFQIQMSSGKMLHQRNIMRTQPLTN